jgi:hypothetical protein
MYIALFFTSLIVRCFFSWYIEKFCEFCVGVAPDHFETKSVINDFSKIAADQRCSFLGNVSVWSIVCWYQLIASCGLWLIRTKKLLRGCGERVWWLWINGRQLYWKIPSTVSHLNPGFCLPDYPIDLLVFERREVVRLPPRPRNTSDFAARNFGEGDLFRIFFPKGLRSFLSVHPHRLTHRFHLSPRNPPNADRVVGDPSTPQNVESMCACMRE